MISRAAADGKENKKTIEFLSVSWSLHAKSHICVHVTRVQTRGNK